MTCRPATPNAAALGNELTMPTGGVRHSFGFRTAEGAPLNPPNCLCAGRHLGRGFSYMLLGLEPGGDAS
jgi:hypothetical protein